jgi:hypothetical protein
MSFLSFFKEGQIEFLCDEQDWGVIPPPIPARKFIPEWYKKLQMRSSGGLKSSTVKRCPPFLDAMQLGWIIPLAADVEFRTSDTAGKVDWNSSFYKPMVDAHAYQQVTTAEAPNPILPKPPLKFMNHWMIRVPKGYSVMFIPPLNRKDPRFECMAGVVECDKYFEYVNFPFTFNEPNFHGILEAGTPLVQIIPVKRSSFITKAKISKMNNRDVAELELTRRKRSSHESYYRDKLWERK